MGAGNFTCPLINQSDGNIIYAAEAMAELTTIKTNANPTGLSGYQDTLAQKQLQEDPATGLTTSLAKDLEQIRFVLAQIKGTQYWYSTLGGGGVPIGSIIPFYDFNGALTFNTDYWVYCDGQSATVGGSSRTLPDLSGRYLVGFGTPNGGGDIDSAAWATAAVGATSHTSASIAHTHTGPSHTHTTQLFWGVSNVAIASARSGNLTASLSKNYFTWSGGSFTSTTDTWYQMLTDADGTGATGSALTTISVQPESVRVRFIMRKA